MTLWSVSRSAIAAVAPLAEPRAKALRRVADEGAPKWLDEISGIASLPHGKRDAELVYDAIVEKHGDAR